MSGGDASEIGPVNTQSTPAMRLFRFRSDIQWTRYSSESTRRWVARDPISLEYFYFSDLERRLALALDGKRTLPEIASALKYASLSRPVNLQWIGSMVARFDGACLLVPDQPDSARRLALGASRRSQRTLLSTLLSPLAVRMPLFDPTPWLERLEFPASLLLNRFTVCLSLLFVAIVGCLATTRWLDGSSVLDPLPQLLQGERLLWIAVCYAVVKSLHELGHALVCHRFGAECHDIGILFLCFTPCLYCDVSDTWKLESRWSRAAVAAAGIYVELVLAAIAAVVWLTTQPGPLQALAVNVMLICSVGTVLVNANPLLKYDGYYVLSDLWGVPNPSEQGQEVLHESIVGWFSGSPLPGTKWDAHPAWLALYGLASFIYRHAMVVLILWAIHVMLVPLGLGILALFLTGVTILGLGLSWWRGIGRMSLRILFGPALKTGRAFLFLAAVAGAIGVVCYVPLPTSVRCRAVSRFVRLEPIFAAEASQVVFSRQAGSKVRAGESVLRLDSPEQRIELLRTRGAIAQLQERREQLEVRSVDDPSAVVELPTIVEALAEKQRRATSLERELAALEKSASSDGEIVLSSLSLPAPLSQASDRMSRSSPLDPANLGCVVERGSLVGWIANPRDGFLLEAFVSDRDAELIRLGAAVRCRWDGTPSDIRQGTVERISPEQLKATPVELIGDAHFISVRNEFGDFAPEQPSYRVQVALKQIPPTVIHGSLATVHIEVAPRTLLESIVRILKQSFRYLT